MMKTMPETQRKIKKASRLRTILQASIELGPQQLGLYGLYLLGLRLGYFRWATRRPQIVPQGTVLKLRADLLTLPDVGQLAATLGGDGQVQLLAHADEVASGRVRLFGGQDVPLRLEPPAPLVHWTEAGNWVDGDQVIGSNGPNMGDVKYVWEPGRFGWAYMLARAYHLSGDERYPAAFWEHTQTFLRANPPYLGPHWASAQEVALRLMALVFAWQVFQDSLHSSPQRAAELARAIADHATRIPPTLIYARAQNNNHLLSEAAGLYTAGLALPDHPSAERWRRLGWRWFNRGLQAQIAEDGAYAQHSANYHRLMLQLALWMDCLQRAQGETFLAATQERLAAGMRWLLALVDPRSGGVPNLGPNDGAYILPLAVSPFGDYRPALQAASAAFLRQSAFEAGTWDEMSLWLVGQQQPGAPPLDRNVPSAAKRNRNTPHILHSPDGDSWAYLRAAHFTARPGHADQLHLDLWWRGLNVAQDAGTYSYNASPPWDNALAKTEVHNTLSVNAHDQMQRAGRFLYLHWAQAKVWSRSDTQIVAQHDGYRRQGILHRRSVSVTPESEWAIFDSLLPCTPQPRTRDAQFLARLHWLLPDWPWELEQIRERGLAILLASPRGPIHLSVNAGEGIVEKISVQVARAGELLYGEGPVQPTWGWSSPTYGDKIPALSLRVSARGSPPLALASRFVFPSDNQSARAT